MIETLLVVGYVLTCIMAARVMYTKVTTDQWFTYLDESDPGTPVVFILAVLAWPLAVVLWLVYRFVTGGVRK